MVYLAASSTLKILQDNCTGCGVCLEVCPREVLEMRDRVATIADIDRCIECGACALNCKYEAISVQSGVGCAAALINSIKNGGEPSCGCSGDSCCG